MVDYLCLKLHWTTDMVLDNAHFDNNRKFNTYRLIDEIDNTRPITAIPIIDNKDMGTVQRMCKELELKLMTRMGVIVRKVEALSPDKDPMRKMLRKITGQPLVPIERLLHYVKNKPKEPPKPKRPRAVS